MLLKHQVIHLKYNFREYLTLKMARMAEKEERRGWVKPSPMKTASKFFCHSCDDDFDGSGRGAPALRWCPFNAGIYPIMSIHWFRLTFAAKLFALAIGVSKRR